MLFKILSSVMLEDLWVQIRFEVTIRPTAGVVRFCYEQGNLHFKRPTAGVVRFCYEQGNLHFKSITA